MIDYKDIKIAINNQLERTGIQVSSRDVTEGFDRPSFFVQLDNNIKSSTETHVYRKISVYIYYFPSDREEYSIENLEMQETLEDLFDLKLVVKDRLLNINDVTTTTTDGVLSFSFDLEYWNLKDSYIKELEDTEKMESLDINMNRR